MNTTTTGALRPHSLGESLATLHSRWGWFVAFGALSSVLGFIILSYLTVTGTIVSVLMIGFFMILAGGAQMALSFSTKGWGAAILWIVVGLLTIIAGAFTVAQPLIAAEIFTLFIGCSLIATGIMRIVAAMQLHVGRGMLIFAGAIALLLGIMILASWPASGLFVLGIFLGVDLLLHGFGWISFGMRLRHG